MPLEYRNNLNVRDRVLVVSCGRYGEVANQPREKSTNVRITLDGNNCSQYFPVKDVRLVLNGKPEDVAPIDGEIPEWVEAPKTAGIQPRQSGKSEEAAATGPGNLGHWMREGSAIEVRTQPIHELKTWPEHFWQVVTGAKRFELRRNDRNFAKGDIVRLREFEPNEKRFTGREVRATIGYVTDWPMSLQPGHCCFMLENVVLC